MLRVGLVLLVMTLLLSAQIQKRSFDTQKLSEASGLLVSQKYPGVLWSHNDSGDKPRLYALDAKTLTRIATIKVKKAEHVDWEDLSYYNGQIVIADTGNNKNRRNDLMLYVVNEPNPYTDKKIKSHKRLPFVFEDQAATDKKIKNFDCEAVFACDGALYLLSKHRSDTGTTLYRLEGEIAKKISDYPIGGKVTAADSDGTRIVVLTYEHVTLFEPKKGVRNLLSGKVSRKHIRHMGQAEGIALEGDMIHIISEKGEFFTLHVKDLDE